MVQKKQQKALLQGKFMKAIGNLLLAVMEFFQKK